jgi:hypothetical protein
LHHGRNEARREIDPCRPARSGARGGRHRPSGIRTPWPGAELAGSRATFAARATNDLQGLIAQLEPFFVRTPKSALGLPPPRIITHDVELAPLQREVYDLIFARLRRGIADAALWPDKIDALRRARPIRLLQAASNPDLLNAVDGFFRLPPIEQVGGTLLHRLHRYRDVGDLPAKFTG